eukprot:TRINITY_DN919_c1_g1_i1.p1 TRINITY_DN919_c1_g1~~TRINITY_DN919_c1_g1_i1.p1  ORF type:complete len:107 (-),score=10.87 TRINITY_DN919_c1_g1_i1:189-509(-)
MLLAFTNIDDNIEEVPKGNICIADCRDKGREFERKTTKTPQTIIQHIYYQVFVTKRSRHRRKGDKDESSGANECPTKENSLRLLTCTFGLLAQAGAEPSFFASFFK